MALHSSRRAMEAKEQEDQQALKTLDSELRGQLAAQRAEVAELLADGRCSVAAAHPDLNRYSDCWPLDSHLVDTGPPTT